MDITPAEFFTHLEIQDPAKRKSMIIELLDGADEDKLKLVYRLLSTLM